MGFGERLADLVLSGSLPLAIPVAALAGLVSFASPCVLPLVPGYLGYVTGLGGASGESEGPSRARMLAGAGGFVLGFSAVFVLIGFTVGALGGFLLRWSDELARGLGVLVILLGLMFIGWLPGAGADRRFTWRPAAGVAGSPLLGAVFGLGWAPCIGPVFSAVALLGAQSGTAGRAGVLAAAYCLGLGLPFLLVAAGLGGWTGWLRRHRLGLQRFGGVMLVTVGLLLVTGVWSQWVEAIRLWINGADGFRTVI